MRENRADRSEGEETETKRSSPPLSLRNHQRDNSMGLFRVSLSESARISRETSTTKFSTWAFSATGDGAPAFMPTPGFQMAGSISTMADQYVGKTG